MNSQKKIRVCHFSSVHRIADIRIFHKECVSLASKGFDVTLIGVDDVDKQMMLNGVNVISVRNTYKGRLARMLKFSKFVFKKALELDADIYHFHDPELMKYGKKLIKKGKKVIYDVHEDVPRQILTKNWIPKLIRQSVANRFETMEDRYAKVFSGIVAATPLIENRFKKNNNKVICIFNSPLLKEFNLAISPAIDKRKVVYIGLITRQRGIVELIRALEHVNAQLLLAGKFESDELLNFCKSLPAWNKVEYFGVVDRSQIASILTQGSIGMVTLHPTLNYKDSLPIKMFEYMGAALPVIASDFELWKTIIEQNNCGLCVDPLNPEKIAGAIAFLLDDVSNAKNLGLNGRKYVLDNFNWEIEENKLVDFYNSL